MFIVVCGENSKVYKQAGVCANSNFWVLILQGKPMWIFPHPEECVADICCINRE
jgi:hypothetical protein